MCKVYGLQNYMIGSILGCEVMGVNCPRCGCELELEYDDEGYRCGADCMNCEWPSDEEE